MTRAKKIFFKLARSLFVLAPLSLITFNTNLNNTFNYQNTTDFSNVSSYDVQDVYLTSSSLESEGKKINMGVNRIDIFIKNIDSGSLRELKEVLNIKFKTDFPIKHDKYTGVLSIAHVKKIDNKKLLEFIIDWLKTNKINYSKIYNFNTNTYYDDFIKGNKKTLKNIVKQNELVGRHSYPYFYSDTENVQAYNMVGLNIEDRSKHFKRFIDSDVKVGVLEAFGVIEDDYKGFTWNKKYGNDMWWRNHWLYGESYSRHASQVAEIIVGKKGINPTLGLVSVQVDLNWNGLSGEMDYLLYYTNIVNNSWGLEDFIPKYNWLSEYLDRLIHYNTELINIIAAGNEFEEKKVLGDIALSRNSVVVGAIDFDENKTFYSQIGNDWNYVSVVAPGTYTFSEKSPVKDKNGEIIRYSYQGTGTSLSAPVITAIAGTLKQKFKHYFDLGYDSLIFKTSLIAGSRKPKNSSTIYSPETGYGIPQYKKIEEAVQNILVFKYVHKSRNSTTNQRKVFFHKGDKIRATLGFLYHGHDDKTDVDLKILDENNNIISQSISSTRNIEVTEFEIPETGYYKFQAYRYDTIENSTREVVITYVKE
ncbi:S8 family serine peptidase [Mesomycoplasma ovipneumoniae]|uniref:S8 family serine peptidase n=1 Tax=Mesomycoplasma ovipneumoniae TaxID=29562 RepID=A0AAJ2UDR9_9BACT|nr:S8 family serine peptidase [Mesomycoplasma ovipneumoniae]MDW2906245.1 S8 family serine peptidase [Mesomycoplasma ovipneumoniae]MDW2914041.1 S8 family serine peptidase [Mesomycoplasma ovipneumoniae]